MQIALKKTLSVFLFLILFKSLITFDSNFLAYAQNDESSCNVFAVNDKKNDVQFVLFDYENFDKRCCNPFQNGNSRTASIKRNSNIQSNLKETTLSTTLIYLSTILGNSVSSSTRNVGRVDLKNITVGSIRDKNCAESALNCSRIFFIKKDFKDNLVAAPTMFTVILDQKCGDGILDFGEECDDGNNISGNSCGCDCMVTNTAVESIKFICPEEPLMIDIPTSNKNEKLGDYFVRSICNDTDNSFNVTTGRVNLGNARAIVGDFITNEKTKNAKPCTLDIDCIDRNKCTEAVCQDELCIQDKVICIDDDATTKDLCLPSKGCVFKKLECRSQ